MATKRRAVKRAAKRARVTVVSNTEGYKDASGRFHSIRGSGDYDPSEAGERGKDEFGYAKRKKAVKRKAAKKNPHPAFPVGKFVKVDAVKLNRNGTIDIMRSKSKRPRR